MTLEDHQSSRMVVDPLHLFDCCLVSNGAVAVIMTTADRAEHLRQPPVYVRAAAQAAPGDNQRARPRPGHRHGAEAGERAGVRAWRASRATTSTSSSCTTATPTPSSSRSRTTASARRARAAPFVEDGKLGPGGSLPTNTGGGQLSSLLHVGLHAAVGGRHPGARPGRRAAGREERHRAGERQRRRAELPLDDDPEQACRPEAPGRVGAAGSGSRRGAARRSSRGPRGASSSSSAARRAERSCGR